MDTIIAAIQAATGSAGVDPTAQRAANAWLHTYSESNEAWESSLKLLHSSDSNVQFFAANMLCSKIRTSWLSLEAATRRTIYDALLATLQSVLTGALSLSSAAQNRLCGGVSTAAALSGGDACVVFLKQTLSLGTSASHAGLAVELLQAFGQETLLRPNAQADVIRPLIACELPGILAVLENYASHPDIQHRVFSTAKAFIRAGLHLSTFFGSSSGLLSQAFHAMGAASGSALTAAVEFVCELVGDAVVELSGVQGVLLPDSLSDPSKLPADTFATLSGIVATIDAFNAASARIPAALDSEDHDLVHVLCRVGVSILDGVPEFVAQCSPQCVALLSCLLQAQASPKSSFPVKEYVCDSWRRLLQSPVVARRGMMAEPTFYTQLAHVVLASCCYPVGFTTWKACDADVEEDEFVRYREHVCGELLCDLTQTLGGGFVSFVSTLLQTAVSSSDWRMGEACLFGLLATHTEVKSLLRQAATGVTAFTATTAVPKLPVTTSPSETTVLVTNTLTSALSLTIPLLSVHACVVPSYCRLVGSYSVWLASQTQLIDGVVDVLLRAMTLPVAADQAVNAIRNVCGRSGAVFHKGSRIASLIDVLHTSTLLAPETKCTLAHATSRLLNSAPADVVTPLLGVFLQPFVDKLLSSALDGGLTEQLTTMSHALRCLDSSTVLPVLVPFVSALWPLLTTIVTRHGKAVEVTTAVFDVVVAVVNRGMVAVAGPSVVAHANDLIQAAVNHGSAESSVPAVACIGTMVSALYDALSPDAHRVLASTLQSCCEAALTAPAHASQLIATVFEVSAAFVPFHSLCPLPLDVLQLLLRHVPALLFGQAAETQQAVAYFVTVCVRQCSVMTYDIAGTVQSVEALVHAQVPVIVPALVKCVVDASQPRSLEFLATAVASCIKFFPQASVGSVAALFADGSFSGSKVASLAPVVAAVFTAVPAHADEAGHEVPFLCDFFCDFTEVCHGRAVVDVLKRFVN